MKLELEKAIEQQELALAKYELVVKSIKQQARVNAEEELREELLWRQEQEKEKIRGNQRRLYIFLTFIFLFLMLLK